MNRQTRILSFDQAKAHGSSSRQSVRRANPYTSSRPSNQRVYGNLSNQRNYGRYTTTNSVANTMNSSRRRPVSAGGASFYTHEAPSHKSSYSSAGMHPYGMDRASLSRAQRAGRQHAGVYREEQESYNGSSAADGNRHSMQKPADQGRIAQIRKAFRSKKADKNFEKYVGSTSRDSKPQETSRAAVYRMEMGRSQKRSTRLQDGRNASRNGGNNARSFSAKITRSPLTARFVIVGCALLFSMVMLYQPVANYYNETRQLQQLEAEYAVLVAHNQEVKDSLEYLSTDEGLEEYAHEKLGWIRKDEHAVTVEGVNPVQSDEPEQADRVVTTIPAGSIPTPTTWYSPVLDIIFGYSG